MNQIQKNAFLFLTNAAYAVIDRDRDCWDQFPNFENTAMNEAEVNIHEAIQLAETNDAENHAAALVYLDGAIRKCSEAVTHAFRPGFNEMRDESITACKVHGLLLAAYGVSCTHEHVQEI